MKFEKISDIEKLQNLAHVLRKDIVEMIGIGSRGHLGGSLSAAELVAAIYFYQMDHDPENPCWRERDRFLLSKGHAAPVQYAALAECGYFPKSEFRNFKKIDGMLQGHPDMAKTPGIEANTGSLGQGLSLGNGMALGLKKDDSSSRVYVLIGDGELGEGQIWEAATIAPHYKLDNLVAIIDKNGVQAMGFTCDRINQGNIAAKWDSFGWEVFETNGHNMASIIQVFDQVLTTNEKPKVIIAETIKGKGVSFAENTAEFHNNEMNSRQYEQAIKEINSLIHN